jgi:LmbE family N-acetylglucosaminyl deacetylase
MRVIYLSPHLDDAILSAGGLIHDEAKAGKRIEIWTLMSGIPGNAELSDFAREMHAQWGTTTGPETVRARRAEDRNAAARVGARSVHFDFLDCMYRQDDNRQPLYSEALHVPIHMLDAALPLRIAEALRRKLREDDLVVCQLGIGEHVDHLIVRAAAEMLERPLRYDADLPYLLNHPDELAEKSASMTSAVEPVSSNGLAAWLQAIEAYRSQLTSLFESRDSMQERMRAYWSEAGGIRLWSRPASAQSEA